MPAQASPMRPVRLAAGNLAAAAAAFVTSGLSLLWLSPGSTGPPLVSLHAGAALGAILLLGLPAVPGIAAGLLAAPLALGQGPGLAAADAAGGVLTAVAALLLLRRASAPGDVHNRVRWVYTLLLAAAACAPAHATLGAFALSAAHGVPWAEFGGHWWEFWFADALGVILLTPVALAWLGPWRDAPRSPREWAEGLVALLIAAALNGLLLTGWIHEPDLEVLLAVLTFPVLIWAAVRVSPAWVCGAVLAVASLAAAATARDRGPFHEHRIPGGGPASSPTLPDRKPPEAAHAQTRVALLWGYTGALGVTVLLMNALVLERRAGGAQRERLAAVLEATSDFVGTCDAVGRVMTLNAGARRLLGVTGDLHGRAIRELHPPWAFDRIEREGIPSAARHGEWFGETAVLTADGREVPVSQVIIAHRNRQGRVEFFSTIMRDMSESRRAHDALRDREARLRLVIDQIPAILWTTDRALRFTSSVGNGLAALNLRPNEVVGLSLAEYFDSPPPDFAPLAAARRALDGEASSFEVGWAGRVFRAHVEPLRDASDAIVGTIGIALDITSRAAAETALRRSEERYRVLVEGVHAIGWEADPLTRDFTFVSRGAETITGFSAEQWLAPGFWAEHIHPDDRDRTLGASAELAARGGPFELEYRFIAADGGTLWLRDYVSIEMTNGRPERLYGVIIDATERKALEERLYQAQKTESIGRLAGGIAHDFNNILTAVLGCLDLIDLDLGGEHPSRAHVTVARRASEHAADLTRQLLAFARRQVIEPKVVDLNALVLDTRSMLRRLLGEDIDLTIDPAPEPCTARIDPGQFEQILVNLAVNARDAMPTGGRLTIATRASPPEPDAADAPAGHVVLSVRDTGVGMDESVRRHIFEPFFTTKGPGRGTGLGLATVYGIVEQHGGKIRLDSAPGRGAAFEIALPRALAELAPASRATSPARPAPAQGTILLLEDDPLVRSVAALTLRAEGYEVLEAGDPDQAVRLSADHPGTIDLLLTDVVLPKFSGTRAAEIITGQRPSLRVLFTSGHTDDAVVHHGVIADTVDFLPKPYTPATLSQRVREALERPPGTGPAELTPASAGLPRTPGAPGSEPPAAPGTPGPPSASR